MDDFKFLAGTGDYNFYQLINGIYFSGTDIENLKTSFSEVEKKLEKLLDIDGITESLVGFTAIGK